MNDNKPMTPEELKVKRPMLRHPPCPINCRCDGNQVSAMIGPNPMEGCCGYGDNLPESLRNLADELEREVGQEPISTESIRREAKREEAMLWADQVPLSGATAAVIKWRAGRLAELYIDTPPAAELRYCGKCNQRRYFKDGQCEMCTQAAVEQAGDAVCQCGGSGRLITGVCPDCPGTGEAAAPGKGKGASDEK
jgi:hypothetical protein